MNDLKRVNDFDRMFLGFDELFGSMGLKRTNSNLNYPPTDIWTEESKTYVQLAVAGFKKENIKVEVEDNSLKISGITEKVNNCKELRKYHSNSISRKSFERVFALADSAEVESAQIVDGLLTVVVKYNKAEKSVKRIEIA